MISKRTRMGLFFIALLLFLVGGTLVSFYSVGWRIDFRTLAVAKTGAMFFETSPRGVTIDINGARYADRSNFFQNGTLILNLIPGEYQIEIKKTGYSSWAKTLTVLPEIVTEAVNVLLIPEKPSVASTSLKDVKGKLIETSQRGGELLSLTHDVKGGMYYLYRLDTSLSQSAKNVTSEFRKFVPDRILAAMFMPGARNQLLIETNGGIYSFDPLSPSKPEVILDFAPSSWKATPSKIFYFASSAIYSVDMNGGAPVLVFSTSSLSVSDLAISRSESKIAFTDGDGALYFIFLSTPIEARVPVKLSSYARDFAFSPQNDILAFLKEHDSIGLYFTEDIERGLRQKKGDSIVFSPSPGREISKIAWYDNSAHLFLFSQSKSGNTTISLTEIDYRTPINTATLLKDEASAHTDGGRVFFLRDGVLWYFDVE